MKITQCKVFKRKHFLIFVDVCKILPFQLTVWRNSDLLLLNSIKSVDVCIVRRTDIVVIYILLDNSTILTQIPFMSVQKQIYYIEVF